MEAGRLAARETLEDVVVKKALNRLRAEKIRWAPIDMIMENVWEVSKNMKLFKNRGEFEKYWTKRKLALVLKHLKIKSKRKQENGKRRWGYIL